MKRTMQKELFLKRFEENLQTAVEKEAQLSVQKSSKVGALVLDSGNYVAKKLASVPPQTEMTVNDMIDLALGFTTSKSFNENPPMVKHLISAITAVAAALSHQIANARDAEQHRQPEADLLAEEIEAVTFRFEADAKLAQELQAKEAAAFRFKEAALKFQEAQNAKRAEELQAKGMHAQPSAPPPSFSEAMIEQEKQEKIDAVLAEKMQREWGNLDQGSAVRPVILSTGRSEGVAVPPPPPPSYQSVQEDADRAFALKLQEEAEGILKQEADDAALAARMHFT